MQQCFWSWLSHCASAPVCVSPEQAAEEIAARRKVRLKTELLNQDPPATCSDTARLLTTPLP